MSIIESLKDANQLIMYHDYRSSSFIDFSGNSNVGAPTNISISHNGLNYFGTTSVVTVADAVNMRLTTGALVILSDLFLIQPSGGERFISKRDAGGTNYDFYAKDATTIAFYDGSTEVTITNNVIGHRLVGCNFNSGEIPELFLDNSKVGNFSGSVTVTADDADLKIGNLYSGSEQIDRTIQVAMIINRKLTETEWSKLYGELTSKFWASSPNITIHSGSKVRLDESDLVGSWSMDAVGNKIIDNKYSNNGTTNIGLVSGGSVFGNRAYFNGTNTYIDVGDTSQTVKTVSFIIEPTTTTEDIIDFDGGTHTIEVSSGTLTATGFSSPAIYINGEVSSTLAAGRTQHVAITTATGFTASNFDIGRVSSSYLDGRIIDSVDLYSGEKSASWVSEQYQKLLLARYKMDWGVRETTSNLTTGLLSNTGFEILSGTWKVSTSNVGVHFIKCIECVSAGVIYIDVGSLGQTPTEAAFGTWNFQIYKNADANVMDIMLVADVIGGASAAGQDGYGLRFDSDETIALVESVSGTPTDLISSAAKSLQTIYNVTVTRKTNTGKFKLYIDGADQGTATDLTVTQTSFISCDFDSGDKMIISSDNGELCMYKGYLAGT